MKIITIEVRIFENRDEKTKELSTTIEGLLPSLKILLETARGPDVGFRLIKFSEKTVSANVNYE